MPFRIANATINSSTPPAPSRCPSMLLVLDTGNLYAGRRTPIQRVRLGLVVGRGAGAVGVQYCSRPGSSRRRAGPRIARRPRCRPGAGRSCGRRRRGAVAGEFAVDVRPAGLRVFVLFEDHNPAAFAQDEPVPRGVERPAGVGGLSFRVQRAVSRLNPVTPNGGIMPCDPPEQRSASPWRIISAASPTARALAAYAVRQVKFGPSRSNSSASGRRWGASPTRLRAGRRAGGRWRRRTCRGPP